VEGPVSEFFFEGIEEVNFAKRINAYLNSISGFMPWLNNARLVIESANTFPHSSGIASSASSMSALAMGLCEIDSRITGAEMDEEMMRKASFLSRLGSGSASRSVWPGMAVWGKTAAWSEASDEYAIPVETIHDDFRETRDTILIIESGKKKVSSTLGHSLMDNNPFAKTRFQQAETNIQRLRPIIESGDWKAFIDLMEHEALTLHAMMMTSNPGFILMQPGTLTAIERLRTFRKETAIPVGFTLDAGANMHLIYPGSAEKKVGKFIDQELKVLCEDEKIIYDKMGDGPVKSIS